jgi:XTP/dITP diphosphohydrolase
MQFGGVIAVNDLNIVVKEHEIIALIGPNGAGKTTTFKALLGLVAADGGEIEIFGNRRKALTALQGKDERGCQFKTVITFIKSAPSHPEGKEITQVEGIVRGEIAHEEYGEGGFGYDPLFIPEGYDKTFGELPPEIKNSISHRARAMEALANILKCTK